MNKINLKTFICGSEDVCRLEEGSTNAFLHESRAIEDFLKLIEPKYNSSIDKCLAGKFDDETIFVLSGFAAYILTCAPASLRFNSDWMQKVVESSAKIMDKKGALPTAPVSLGSKSISEMLDSGSIKTVVDKKFPQAVGISKIFEIVGRFGNAKWDILINRNGHSPFFTSDFPVAIEATSSTMIQNRLVPLSPELAIRIHSNPKRIPLAESMNFPEFKYRIYSPDQKEIERINRLIVRCAEEKVFYQKNHRWVERFIKKNADFCINSMTQKIPNPDGEMLFNTLVVSARTE